MRWHAWAFAAVAATVLLFACVGSSPTLPDSQCDGTDTFCGGACTNTQGDPRNCGKCGTTCNTQAGEVCQKGACGPPCTGGTSRCGSSCADVQNDPQNCGDCNKKCASAESCVMGKCSLVCQMGLTACPRSMSGPTDGGTSDSGTTDGGSSPASGNACVDVQTDPMNCGKCGNVCPPDKNGCDMGVCKLYKFAGIVTNFNQSDLSSQWKECWTSLYSSSGNPLSTILNTNCPQANLMLGCRLVNTKTLIAAAEAPRADVTFDVGTGFSAYHIANGAAWYYNSSYSWGFFEPLDGVARSSCDTATGLVPEHRLCWHTSNGNLGIGMNNGGYRCGSTTGLNASTQYEQVILQAP